MFCHGSQFNIHCMSNPFGMGFPTANPKINFCLGLASATSGMGMPSFGMPMVTPMAMYRAPMLGMSGLFSAPMFGMSMPVMPMMGSLFQAPSLNSLSTPFFGMNNGYSNYSSETMSMPVPDFLSPFTKTMLASATSGNIPTFHQPIFNFNNLFSSSNISVQNNSSSARETELKLNNTYGPKFLEKTKQIAKRLNCDYKDLLGLMNSESGINSKAGNPNGGATGLIQFMPSTAKKLGTTTTALKNMSPIEQLDYVEKYLIQAKAAAGFSSSDKISAGDLYALTFLPGRANREVLTSQGENFYAQNSGLDANKDGKITKTELGQRVKRKHVSDSSFLA